MKIEDIDNGTIRETVEEAMKLRQEAARLEKQAEELKQMANNMLLPLFDVVGEEKVEWEGVGTVSRVAATRSSLDKDKLKETLVAKGVPVGVIVDSFYAATKVSESVSVRFSAGKE